MVGWPKPVKDPVEAAANEFQGAVLLTQHLLLFGILHSALSITLALLRMTGLKKNRFHHTFHYEAVILNGDGG